MNSLLLLVATVIVVAASALVGYTAGTNAGQAQSRRRLIAAAAENAVLREDVQRLRHSLSRVRRAEMRPLTPTAERTPR